MSTKHSTRLDGTIQIEGDISKRSEVVSTLVGRGGSNLRRIRNTVGNRTYIRIYDSRRGRDVNAKPIECDTIYIASNSKAALHKAVQLLRQDMNSVLKGTRSSKPQLLVKVAKETVGTIIGAGGSTITEIAKFAGLGCYILYKEELGGFLVTGDSTREIGLAQSKIKEKEHDYFEKQKEWQRRRNGKGQNRSSNVSETGSNNSFAGLMSSDEESEDEELDMEVKVVKSTRPRHFQQKRRHFQQKPMSRREEDSEMPSEPAVSCVAPAITLEQHEKNEKIRKAAFNAKYGFTNKTVRKVTMPDNVVVIKKSSDKPLKSCWADDSEEEEE